MRRAVRDFTVVITGIKMVVCLNLFLYDTLKEQCRRDCPFYFLAK